ncbi:MAG TPA: corrinoid protein [Candidatus Desulfaltia sp.]|nr:corrinoid protein [Candidatus Desulfaltia sp.]
MRTLTEIAASVEAGDSARVKELTRKALSQGHRPEKILDDGLIQGMSAIGEKFKSNEVFIPEVLIASRAMNVGLEILRPLFSPEREHFRRKIVLATVKGDLHDIGKKIVGMMLEGAGYKVVDLGIDVPKRTIVRAVKINRPSVLGLSALLTTTMSYMRDVVEAIEHAGLRRRVRIVIGGAPVTRSYADEIGADGYAPDAASALEVVKRLSAKK